MSLFRRKSQRALFPLRPSSFSSDEESLQSFSKGKRASFSRATSTANTISTYQESEFDVNDLYSDAVQYRNLPRTRSSGRRQPQRRLNFPWQPKAEYSFPDIKSEKLVGYPYSNFTNASPRNIVIFDEENETRDLRLYEILSCYHAPTHKFLEFPDADEQSSNMASPRHLMSRDPNSSSRQHSRASSSSSTSSGTTGTSHTDFSDFQFDFGLEMKQKSGNREVASAVKPMFVAIPERSSSKNKVKQHVDADGLGHSGDGIDEEYFVEEDQLSEVGLATMVPISRMGSPVVVHIKRTV